VEDHADGHVMGLGIAIPRSVPLRERAKILAPILFDAKTNQPKTLELKMGRAGVWKIERETSISPRLTLRTETYTAASRTWASVTPVLLDRMPKPDRVKEPIAWREEVARIVSASCGHLFNHLEEVERPAVLSVRTEKTPFFRGSLRAMPGQGGFPQLRNDKHQVHVVLEFDRPVQGPMVIGAGRFRGYGLMRPWKEEA
jgi:CRISPR-associated protein Csb2